MAEDYRSYAEVRHRGIQRVGWVFTFAAAAYNLVRMRNLLEPGWCRMSQGRSVPAGGQSGQNEPQIEARTHFQRNLGSSVCNSA